MKIQKISGGIVYLMILMIVILWRKDLIQLMEAMHTGNWPAILAVASMIGMVPIIPYAIVSGILGIKFGLWVGGAMSVVASTIAAIMTYLIFITGKGRIQTNSSISKFNYLHTQIRNRAFLFVLIGRMLPFVPAAVINGYAGLYKLPFKTFIVATILGKIPTMFVFAYMGLSVVSESTYWLPVIIFYCIFLGAIYIIYKKLFPVAQR